MKHHFVRPSRVRTLVVGALAIVAATLAEWDKSGDVDGLICGMIEGSNLKPNLSKPAVRLRRNSRKG